MAAVGASTFIVQQVHGTFGHVAEHRVHIPIAFLESASRAERLLPAASLSQHHHANTAHSDLLGAGAHVSGFVRHVISSSAVLAAAA